MEKLHNKEITYNEKLDADEQITAEEDIAFYLFDFANNKDAMTGQCDIDEEDAQVMSRQILGMVLARFRPDLIHKIK